MLAATTVAALGMSTNPSAPIKIGVNGFGRIGRQVRHESMPALWERCGGP